MAKNRTWSLRLLSQLLGLALSALHMLATATFQVVFAFLVLAHDRKRIRTFQRHRLSDGLVDRTHNLSANTFREVALTRPSANY
jgi:hypothetical protein